MRTLLEFFFQIHDPSAKNRQGNDIGASYRSAISYTSDEQRKIAEDTIADVDASGLVAGQGRHRGDRGGRLPNRSIRTIYRNTPSGRPGYEYCEYMGGLCAQWLCVAVAESWRRLRHIAFQAVPGVRATMRSTVPTCCRTTFSNDCFV
nr:peptide-methionine (S)-S-oxide reductase [Nonomuraea cypriaca]